MEQIAATRRSGSASSSAPNALWICGVALVALLAGCAHYPVNQPVNQYDPQSGYRARNLVDPANDERLLLMLSFSGGGTRAAAFSYGVLETLRDTPVQINGRRRRLLDEVDWISGVSGGSFTAAYYGLFEDRTFEDFEARFLKKNVQGDLTRATLFNPLNWGKLLSAYYDRSTSQRTTTTSMSSKERPLVICWPGESR